MLARSCKASVTSLNYIKREKMLGSVKLKIKLKICSLHHVILLSQSFQSVGPDLHQCLLLGVDYKLFKYYLHHAKVQRIKLNDLHTCS